MTYSLKRTGCGLCMYVKNPGLGDWYSREYSEVRRETRLVPDVDQSWLAEKKLDQKNSEVEARVHHL